MKILLKFACFFALVLSLKAQDSTVIINRHYLGFLYTGQFEEYSERYQHYGAARIAIGSEIKVPGGLLRVNVWNDNLDINQTAAHLFYESDLYSWLNLKIGPSCVRPIAISHRPHPVSLWGHFECTPLTIIPGTGLGANLAITGFAGNQLTLGVFDAVADKKHLPEYNADLTQKIGDYKIQVSGLFSSVSSGGAISFKDEKENLSLTYYRGSNGLESGLLWLDSEFWNSNLGIIYVGAINNYLDKSFQNIEFGWLKKFTANFPALGKIQVLTGLGYQPEVTRAVKLYFLVYSE